MLAVVLVIFSAWNSFTLRRARAQLNAAGLYVASTASLMDYIPDDPGRFLRPGPWGSPIGWRARKEVWPRDFNAPLSLHNLDAIASALRRIQPIAITLSGSGSLENVDGLNGLDCLLFLSLSECPTLQDLKGLSRLTNLNVLYVSGCSSLRNVDGIKGLTGLSYLDLRASNEIPAAALRELRIALPNTAITYPDGSASPPE